MTVPTMRAGDREREVTADLLGQALAQGYLDMAEYESRLATVYDAGTSPDLRRLTDDLPVADMRRNDPRRRAAKIAAARRGIHLHLAGYAAMVVVVLTVWLAVGLGTGAWYFWPVWPILGAGLGVLGHALPIRLGFPPAPVSRPGAARPGRRTRRTSTRACRGGSPPAVSARPGLASPWS